MCMCPSFPARQTILSGKLYARWESTAITCSCLLGRSGTECNVTEPTKGAFVSARKTMNDDECGAVAGMIGKEN
jgi:hypothetical protein